MTKKKENIKIAAVGDLHCTKSSQGILQPLFMNMAGVADILVLCGDLTDYGTVEEAEVLVKELGAAGKIPLVGVLGNHDFQSGKAEEVKALLCEAGVHMLDGDACEISGVGFAGTKGFGGGFGRGTLGPWGENAIKAFVQEAIDEALKLEGGLARLRTEHKVAVLHYSPVVSTVQGEPLEIFPFLGSSRLEEPLLRYEVDAVFHGHAHSGTAQGATSKGTPVFNTAYPLMRRVSENAPFRLFELQPHQ